MGLYLRNILHRTLPWDVVFPSKCLNFCSFTFSFLISLEFIFMYEIEIQFFPHMDNTCHSSSHRVVHLFPLLRIIFPHMQVAVLGCLVYSTVPFFLS